MKFNNVMLRNVKVRQSVRTVSYAFCVKNGWWISAVFGHQAWLVRYSKCKTNKFTSAVVELIIPPTVDYDEFVKFVERENEKIYAKHKRYLLCLKKEGLEQSAFDLVVNNMRMTTTNSERTFAMFMLGHDIGEFASLLLRAWTKADGDNQQRLAIAFPQIANAMIKYNNLCSDKKKQKYLKQLIGE